MEENNMTYDLKQEIYRAWAGEYRALPKDQHLAALQALADLLADRANYETVETFRRIAAALRPRSPATPKNATDHLIRFVAGKGEVRGFLRYVWVVGDYVYASDGHTACRYHLDATGHLPESQPYALDPVRGVLPLPRSKDGEDYRPLSFANIFDRAIASATAPADVTDTKANYRVGKRDYIAARLDGPGESRVWVNDAYLKRALNVPKDYPAPTVKINPKDPLASAVIDYGTLGGTAIIMPVRIKE